MRAEHRGGKSAALPCCSWWKYDPKLGYLYLKGTHVALTPTRKIDPAVDQVPGGITGALPVHRNIFGKLFISSDEGIDYRKRSAEERPSQPAAAPETRLHGMGWKQRFSRLTHRHLTPCAQRNARASAETR